MPNYSPVNFFDIDFNLYPLFAEINRRYTVILHDGDCLYIPAFYFYQYVAKTSNTPDKDNLKPSNIAVMLKYESNSALLEGFYDAIEKGILE